MATAAWEMERPNISGRAVINECVRWVKKNWLRTLLFSIISFVVAWVWNTYLMATDLDGSVPPPGSETTATAEGKGFNGIYWLLLSTVGFGIFTYGRERGFKNLLKDLGGLPRMLAAAFTRQPNMTLAMLLWGMSISLIVGTVITGAMAAVIGIGLIAVAPSGIATILNSIAVRVWTGVLSTAKPQLANQGTNDRANPYLIMLGEAFGMIIVWQLDSFLPQVFLALLAAVGSYAIVITTSPKPPSTVTLFLAVLGAAIAWQLAKAGVAFADDGGWVECSNPDTGERCQGITGIITWFGSPGADRLIARGLIGGQFSAVGAALGAILGGALGSLSTFRIRSENLSFSGKPAGDQ